MANFNKDGILSFVDGKAQLRYKIQSPKVNLTTDVECNVKNPVNWIGNSKIDLNTMKFVTDGVVVPDPTPDIVKPPVAHVWVITQLTTPPKHIYSAEQPSVYTYSAQHSSKELVKGVKVTWLQYDSGLSEAVNNASYGSTPRLIVTQDTDATGKLVFHVTPPYRPDACNRAKISVSSIDTPVATYHSVLMTDSNITGGWNTAAGE